jgi:hypothetical protein
MFAEKQSYFNPLSIVYKPSAGIEKLEGESE